MRHLRHAGAAAAMIAVSKIATGTLTNVRGRAGGVAARITPSQPPAAPLAIDRPVDGPQPRPCRAGFLRTRSPRAIGDRGPWQLERQRIAGRDRPCGVSRALPARASRVGRPSTPGATACRAARRQTIGALSQPVTDARAQRPLPNDRIELTARRCERPDARTAERRKTAEAMWRADQTTACSEHPAFTIKRRIATPTARPNTPTNARVNIDTGPIRA